jgi:hypothetical protein
VVVKRNMLTIFNCQRLWIFTFVALLSCSASVEEKPGKLPMKIVDVEAAVLMGQTTETRTGCPFNNRLPFGSPEFRSIHSCYRFYGHFDDQHGVLSVYAISPVELHIDRQPVTQVILYFLNGFLIKKAYILSPTVVFGRKNGIVTIQGKRYQFKKRSSYSILFEMANSGTFE